MTATIVNNYKGYHVNTEEDKISTLGPKFLKIEWVEFGL